MITLAPDHLQAWVWWDFRVAVVTTVIIPLILLAWAFVVRLQPLILMLSYYWRISSLLAVTVYLMIGGFPISFLTGALARAVIPVGLWFWQDLSEAIAAWGGAISSSFYLWRWVLTVYMVIGFFFSAAFLPCGFQTTLPELCQVWFQPPLGFRDIFHPGISKEILGLVGIVGLIAYAWAAVYFWQWLTRSKVQ